MPCWLSALIFGVLHVDEQIELTPGKGKMLFWAASTICVIAYAVVLLTLFVAMLCWSMRYPVLGRQRRSSRMFGKSRRKVC